MIDYIGEHIWPGNIGRIAVIVSLTASLLTSAAYVAYVLYKDRAWLKMARVAYYVHTIAVLSIVGMLFFIMQSHYFEYDYVWKHTSLDLAPKYLFAAFWEGQEGSFILWMFWHALIGIVLLHTSKKWEARVMPVLATVQSFLSTMLLGIYVYGLKIGSSPFTLIRELPENIDLAWTKWPDYIDKFPAFFDGKGLNPLLQNYWMTIHPPTLFLGFALTVVPFSFAIAGLASKKDKKWIKPALPWTLFGVTILGTGILMGGAWAYEALSFGGFWAWDPVENASLVPWIILLSALHLMLVQNKRGNALIAAYLFSLLSFILVIYSSFLTRSGVLGDTSVHAFVDSGMNAQLLIYLLFFTFAGLGLLVYRYKTIPKKKQDDNMTSKEFWMFIGALILVISGVHISLFTSLPIFNIFFGPDGFIPLLEDKVVLQNPIKHFNSVQVPFAVVITLLMSVTQYLSYRNTASSNLLKKMGITLLLSLAIAVASSIALGFFKGGDPNGGIYAFLLFTGIYAIIANIDYWMRLMKGSRRIAGSAVAHIGFGLIIVGALISNYKKQVISQNQSYIHKEFPQNENLLMELQDTLVLGDYKVSWRQERKEGNYRFYDIDYNRIDGDESFTLSPSILRSDKMDMNNAEPSTKHYLLKDIYTHITFADLDKQIPEDDEWSEKMEFEMQKNQEMVLYDQALMRFDTLMFYDEKNETTNEVQKLILGLNIVLTTMDGKKYEAMPLYIIDGNIASHVDATVEELGIKFRFEEVNTEEHKMVIHTWRYTPDKKPFIIIQAVVFPFINLLWLGCIIMAVGTLIAMVQRIKDSRTSS